MRAHACNHASYTSTGHTIQENFAQLLILEATGDPSLVEYTTYEGPFNFFRGDGQFTSKNFPNDADTTSIGLTVCDCMSEVAKHRVMDELLTLRNSDGVLQVYFDASRPRIDPIVCVNVLTLFHTHGRGDELVETFDWVERVLEHRAYVDGTRYYEPAEAFLYFMSRLLAVSPSARARLGPLFVARCRERYGAPGDALALAMRIICFNQEGIDPAVDLERLYALQEADGGWSDGWFYKYGSNGVLIANRGFTTALAINAIVGSRKQGETVGARAHAVNKNGIVHADEGLEERSRLLDEQH
ncbi:hypothetical protein EVG20_g5550 [Dentipellis fragilis]|uniref:Uncharacterized protein n=1 Tax=Dentipellis fragilis TaxID=205917 RepID=A0A4Y9YWN0_9AGAM|nr:hypothetical protein EVG20_g5550 [Dentipellis fragilis]